MMQERRVPDDMVNKQRYRYAGQPLYWKKDRTLREKLDKHHNPLNLLWARFKEPTHVSGTVSNCFYNSLEFVKRYPEKLGILSRVDYFLATGALFFPSIALML